MPLLEYIESIGGVKQYFNTGYRYKSNSRIKAKVKCYSDIFTQYQGVYGSYATNKWWTFYSHTGGTSDFGVNLGTAWSTTGNSIHDEDIIIESNMATGITTWDSATEHYSLNQSSGAGATGGADFYLFCSGYSVAIEGNEFGKYRFYYLEMYEGDTLVHKWMPFLDSNNVACIFDAVTCSLIYNGGTTPFVAGPAIAFPFRYIKMTVSAVRSTSTVLQIADLNFYDANEDRIAYPSGTTAYTDMTTFSGEGVANILDNNPATKVCGTWAAGSTKYLLIGIPDATFLNQIRKYAYCTANDASERDPVSWVLEVSTDGQNWREVDSETNAEITTTRLTLTQKWDCFAGRYKSNGTAAFTLSGYTVGGHDKVHWNAETPTGTSVAFSTSINNGAWQSVTNGGLIAGMPTKGTTCNLRIRAELSTTDVTATPAVTEIKITSDADKKILVLTTAIPNFSSAIGNITVSYDGLGNLRGVGGPTAAFDGVFTPTGLTWKGHQNDEEHVEVSASANVVLTHITYLDGQEGAEHVEVSAAATVTLTDIHDL